MIAPIAGAMISADNGRPSSNSARAILNSSIIDAPAFSEMKPVRPVLTDVKGQKLIHVDEIGFRDIISDVFLARSPEITRRHHRISMVPT